MKLSDIALKTKEVEFAFPMFDSFKVKLTYISKPEEAKLRQEAMVVKVDEKSDLPYQEFDQEKFSGLLASKVVTGWSGLTYEILSNLMVIDDSGIEDMFEEVPYSPENAVTLIKYSKHFDAWVGANLIKIGGFRTKREKSPVQES
ncbi:hypothetical protein [Vibrio phage JSF12]|uniref:Tape measure chaperone n=2 Tax=Jesfedecavirus TaxID=2560156 RepID=A0A2D0Z8J5_9CAUD|nr:hypothetical protein FDI98_gp064 [Vibrio phage JSF10]YP_009794796.1 hypothetical protein HOS35_gp113 [Vibrio phage JSF12]ASV43468.1 hypothetical protein [Vibrio phage JSF10]ASV43631.1 hypothetical protein [Vibrio phage JSF12]